MTDAGQGPLGAAPVRRELFGQRIPRCVSGVLSVPQECSDAFIIGDLDSRHQSIVTTLKIQRVEYSVGESDGIWIRRALRACVGHTDSHMKDE